MPSMFTVPQIDPAGSIIIEARTDPHVTALVGDRVRGPEPAPDDMKGPGDYIAFVTIGTLGAAPERRVPVTFAEYSVSAYGATYQNAWAVWAALTKAFHGRGPRTKANGLGIYATAILDGGQEDEDPQTQQPVVRGTLRVIATVVSVA